MEEKKKERKKEKQKYARCGDEKGNVRWMRAQSEGRHREQEAATPPLPGNAHLQVVRPLTIVLSP